MIFDRIIRHLLPPDDRKFLDIYFVELAEACHASSKLFYEVVTKDEHMNEADYVNAKRIKHKSLEVTNRTVAELNQTFITPIEREDILDITLLLNTITKRILRSATNFKVFRINKFPEAMRMQAQVLMAATAEIETSIGILRTLRYNRTITDSHARMIEIERRGDEIFAEAIDDLFSGKYDALDVIKFRGIYRDIESAMDYCYSVSNSVLNVSIKNK